MIFTPFNQRAELEFERKIGENLVIKSALPVFPGPK